MLGTGKIKEYLQVFTLDIDTPFSNGHRSIKMQYQIEHPLIF